MAEYLGYQGRPEPVDWLKIAQGAITDINAIEADRQKQRDALEKSADDLVTASKEYKPGQSGSFNELILNGADRVRSTTLDLKKKLMNGQITPTEYKASVGRMSEDWKYLGEFAKSYNDIINQGIEYINSPEASKLGEFFLDKQSKLADVANKQIVVDPSTHGVVMTDPDTGMVIDFKSALIPENQRPPKLDVISEVEKFTKGLGETSKFLGGYWTTSPELKAEYQKAKANFTKSLMQNPRGAASILADYVGGYEFYETDVQKKAIEASGGKAIQLVMGPNGIVTPKLTQAQQDEARAVLDRLVDSRIDVERKQPEPVTPKSPSSTDIQQANKSARISKRRSDLEAMYADKTGKVAEDFMKDMVYPGTKEKVERVEFTRDGHVRFFTYSQRVSKVRDKKNKREFNEVVQKVANPVPRVVLGEEAKNIMNQILNTQSKDANIDYDLLYSAQEFAPTPSSQKKKLPGT